MTEKPICKHCGQRRAPAHRGLCWGCYRRPGVKEQYPSTSKYGRRGVGNFRGTAPLPAEPTRARPGSVEKMSVLELRARGGYALFHPKDVMG